MHGILMVKSTASLVCRRLTKDTTASTQCRDYSIHLRTHLVSAATLLLPAVNSADVKAGVAFAADHAVLVELPGEDNERGLDDPSAQTEHQMQSRFLLDVVVSQSAAILQLLAGENKALLIRGDSLLVLDLLLHVLDGVRGLHVECDRLARKGLDENLHRRHRRLCWLVGCCKEVGDMTKKRIYF
jgi:hypothetical protein